MKGLVRLRWILKAVMDKEHLDFVSALTDDGVKHESKSKKHIVVIMVFCITTVICFFLYVNYFKLTEVITSKVIEVKANTYSTSLDAVGYVIAKRQANISSRVASVILALPIKEGDYLEEGQLIAKLDDSVVKSELFLAESNLVSAEQKIREIKVRNDEALVELNRTHKMVNKGFFSQASLDEANAKYNALNARLLSLKSDVLVAQRNYELIKSRVNQYKIVAPFSGVITSKYANLGEMVVPGSTGEYTTTGICTLTDMNSREIEVDVNEAYIKRIFKDQSVKVKLDAYPDWTIKASVINYLPTADRKKATVKVQIKFDELDDRILPGMSVRVKFFNDDYIEDTSLEAKIYIPTLAVKNDDQGSFVWLVKNEELEKVYVNVANPSGNKVEVLEGIHAGDEVVIASKSTLTEHKKVKIIND